MDDVFGPGGLLAGKMTAYEHRLEQQQMAKAVERAFRREGFLIVEAGTGIGKTLAYLVPAALSGKRVIISTGTKTLQEQLFFRDIPFIQERLGFSFRAAFMKGRNNYLCRRRYKLFSQQPMLKGIEEVSHFQVLKKWVGKTKSGDRAELEALPEDLGLWREICATSDSCLGQACECFESCFITRMRQEAAGADLIVVNHHLFIADLAVRLKGYGEVLPRYEAVIFDEAHQLEEVATQYFGASVSNFRIDDLARDIRREAAAGKVKDELLQRMVRDVMEGQERFFELFRRSEPRYRLRPDRLPPRSQDAASSLLGHLTVLAAHIGGMRDVPEGLQAMNRRIEELSGHFQEILALSNPSQVYWCESRGRGIFLHASPIDVSEELQNQLYTRLRTAVFTSATLSTGGNFHFLKERLGLNLETEELILQSSFDMSRQALLYLPNHLPDPNQSVFVSRAAAEIEKILERTRGRAFLLFTSIKNMEEAYGFLKDRLPFTCFLQGERPKSILIRDFIKDTHSVLFATASFWEGVDVQGEALSCVVVDRLPFSNPGEPVTEARLERIAAMGESPFWSYQVPAAIILLKQGLGRLIRTRQDRGVLAILDPRLFTKNYGKAFRESLPPCPVARDLDAVARFFKEEGKIADNAHNLGPLR